MKRPVRYVLPIATMYDQSEQEKNPNKRSEQAKKFIQTNKPIRATPLATVLIWVFGRACVVPL